MDKENLLQQIGLTQKEAQTYLSLLEVSSSTAGELAKKLRVQRSTIYYILDNLQKQGLINFSLKGKRKLFRASDPHVLEQRAQETYKKIKKAIPKLKVQKKAKDKDEALLFVGYKGLVAAYEQMLEESKKGDEFLVLGARGGEDISRRTYRNFYKNFNNRRVKRKINMRVIMNLEIKRRIGGYYEKLSRTKVRYLKQQTLAPIVIFPTAVAIVQWKEEPTLFLLRGSIIKESFKQFFETLWKIARL